MDANNTASETPSTVSNKFSLLRNKEVFIPLIAAVIATYTHFWGYAYLKGKLQMVGLGDIEIELSILESVYQASLSFSDIIKGVITIEGTTILMVLIGTVTTFFLYAVMFSLGDFVGDLIKEKSQQKSHNDAPNSPILKSLKKGTRLSFEVCAVLIILVFLFLVFASTSSLLLNIPRHVGQFSGKALIEKAVCKNIPWKEMEQDRVVSCTRIETINQSTHEKEVHRGVIIFKNSQYTILVSNQKSLLIDKQNKVIAWSEVFEREAESEDENKTE